MIKKKENKIQVQVYFVALLFVAFLIIPIFIPWSIISAPIKVVWATLLILFFITIFTQVILPKKYREKVIDFTEKVVEKILDSIQGV